MPAKTVSVEEAVSLVKSGDKVFIGTGYGLPRAFVGALENTRIHGVEFCHFLPSGFKRTAWRAR
jgi:acyl-CoA hydrolase